jgi:hypothetical protein
MDEVDAEVGHVLQIAAPAPRRRPEAFEVRIEEIGIEIFLTRTLVTVVVGGCRLVADALYRVWDARDIDRHVPSSPIASDQAARLLG